MAGGFFMLEFFKAKNLLLVQLAMCADVVHETYRNCFSYLVERRKNIRALYHISMIFIFLLSRK